MYQIVTNVRFDGETQSIIRVSDNTCIPMDEANMDYQAYLAWVEDGNVAEPWEPDVVD